METAASSAQAGIEQHSVDWIPPGERHGKPSSLGAIWFVGNINLTALATGVAALAISGTSLMWTLIATVIGSLFGTFFMAFHSAQGPQLGLPQLVQSRPQFGYLGAALTVWVFALVNYVSYNTSDALLAGSAANMLFGLPNWLGYLLAAVVAAVVALYGYDWIHRVNRFLTWPFIALMVVVTIAALAGGTLPEGVWDLGPFQLAGFMTVFVLVAGFQLGWAPYVSDYSRYLPADTPVRSTFLWTYLPSALSGVWIFGLGAVVAAAAPDENPVTALKIAADGLVGGLGIIAVVLMLIGLLSVMAINQYGGSLTMISILDSIKPVKPTRALRVATITIMFVLVGSISLIVGIDRFNTFYGNVLLFLTYLFTPWTAINLVDYFYVRRGEYSIKEIFNPHGVYGRWGWRGNLAYLIGLAAMVPFMVTTPFTGPIATSLGNVDYSVFIGLPVSALVYLLASRSLDLARERRLVRDEGILPVHH